MQHLGAALQRRIGGDRLEQSRVEGADAGVEGLQLPANRLLGGGAVQFCGQLAEVGAVVDEALTHQNQVFELAQVALFGRGRLQIRQAPVASQYGSIQAIRLGQQAERLGEAPGAVGAHQDRLAAVRRQALVQLPVVAPGRLEDDAPHAVPAQPVAQGAAPRLVVGEAAGLPAGLAAGVEPTLADSDAGDGLYTGKGHVLRLLGLSRFRACCPRIRTGRTGRTATGRPSSSAGLAPHLKSRSDPPPERGLGQAPARPPPRAAGRKLCLLPPGQPQATAPSEPERTTAWGNPRFALSSTLPNIQA